MKAQYGQNVTVMLNEIECIDASNAIFKLKLSGPSASDILQQLLNDINNTIQGIDISFGVLKVCERNCTKQITMNNTKEKKLPMPILITLAAGIVLFLLMLILIISCHVLIHLRYSTNCKK